MTEETKVEETKVEETKVEETKVEEAPVEQIILNFPNKSSSTSRTNQPQLPEQISLNFPKILQKTPHY